ncbi:MAG: peptidoglycan-associated lipoprotein Pal [Candidatus Coatesbacteria bacterium]|nr:peptidoglycan-associated lipoprotein Pal [Candidatus Coatesbacteria bacterium]
MLLFYGCGPGVKEQVEKDQREEAAIEPQPPDESNAEEETQAEPLEPFEEEEVVETESISFEDINFDFDKYDLRYRSREVLNQIAFTMFDNPRITLVIEGHCDERGSNEYNLALGERRANAARDYLIEMGVEPHRIGILSFGEEMPLDPGHDEIAWAKNRRAHFVTSQ